MTTMAFDLLAAFPLADGRRWGDVAEPFQVEDAKAVLSEDGPPYHFLTRSRGGSKTRDLAGCALALLLTMPARSRLYWLAADADQAALAVDVIANIAAQAGSLAGALEIQARKVTFSRTGSTLEVLPADAPSAWGLTPDGLFVDELANWTDGPAARRLWEAASSAAAKNPACRMVVLTTAGSPDHFAAGVLKHAKAAELWHVHEVEGPAPWLDRERLAEQKARLPMAVYEQLFENRWTAAAGSFLDPAIVDAAFTLEAPALAAEPGRGGYVAGLDLGHSKDRSVLAIVHRQDGEVRLDRMQVWAPGKDRPVDFGEIERFVLAAYERFGFTLHLDPWQGLDLAQRLRSAGVQATEFHFSPASKQRLAGALLHSLNAGKLWLYPAEGLREELLGLRVKQTAGGGWAFDHTAGGHDDRAVALSIALVAALEDNAGDAISVSLVDGGGEPVIERGGLRLTGERFLDRTPEGDLTAPPGWQRT